MGRVVLLTDEEREAIAADLAAGTSAGRVARARGRSISTVLKVARERGIALDQSRTQKAVAARADFDRTARLELLNEGVATARRLLRGITAPHHLQQWSVAVGILIDKRRLEDGQATSRSVIEMGDLAEMSDEELAAVAGRGDGRTGAA